MSEYRETDNGARPLPTWARIVLWLALVGFTAFELWNMYGPSGWVTIHGFSRGNEVYFQTSLSDPVMFAALIDILACVAVAVVLLANALPRGPGYFPALIVTGFLTINYPGFGLLLFLALYWRRLGQFRCY